MTFALCILRVRGSDNHRQLFTLLKCMPVPFVVSDRNGVLLFASEEAAQLMEISKEAAAGQSYFVLLLNATDQGTAVQKYVTLLDAPLFQESVVELKLLKHPEESWTGVLIPVDLQDGKCLVTVIKKRNGQEPSVEK